MSSKYTLTYFDLRGRAEPIRILFHHIGVEFTDKRIELTEEWPTIKHYKDRFPLKKIPTLQVDDVIITESHAILRFLANKYDLSGKTDFEKARVDQIMDSVKNVVEKSLPIFSQEVNDAERAVLIRDITTNALIPTLEFVEDLLQKNNGHIVEDKISVADIMLIDLLDVATVLQPTCLDKLPMLKVLFQRAKSSPAIKKYCDSRQPNKKAY